MAETEGAEGSTVALATSKPAPPKVAYHPNVRCRRGDGCTCGVGPVIVGPMYRVGEVYVCEGAASEEEKANGPTEYTRTPAELGYAYSGFDLRGWKAADILGLRGADGTLDLHLDHAILCGVDLTEAELQGANLGRAQLQGAKLCGVRLQCANLYMAYLQGAYLLHARLQGSTFHDAQLQGADLKMANLQGANLTAVQLQGADLSNALLSALPKGSLLPKLGGWRDGAPPADETEALQEEIPTNLSRANLCVLPKGSEYNDHNGKVCVSDATRPTNLTGAKASGANFTGAKLSGANFTGTTLEHATLKDATFAPLQPPERPASGALSGAWRAKALMGGMAHAAMAAADDEDDDDSDDGSDDDDEEESPVDAKMETVLDVFMDKLATASRGFMHTVDGMVGKVEELLKSSLLKSCKGTRHNPLASVPDADSILAELLCKKLETANDKQAAIFETLATHVISPLFAQHLPKVLKDARSELPKPTDEAGAAGHQLLEQLLETFTERALGAGKAALLKRLSPIVSKCVGAVFSIIEGSAEGGRSRSRRASSRRSVGPGPAADEEQPLMKPEDSAACLVQELWRALRASLEAQARRPSAHTAASPIIMSPKCSRFTVHCLSVCI